MLYYYLDFYVIFFLKRRVNFCNVLLFRKKSKKLSKRRRNMPLSLKDYPESTECWFDLKGTPQSEKPRKKVTVIVFSGKNKEKHHANIESKNCCSEYDSSLVLEKLAFDTTVLDIYYMVAHHFDLNPYSFFLKKSEAESNELLCSNDLMEFTDSQIHNKNVMVELILKDKLSENQNVMIGRW